MATRFKQTLRAAALIAATALLAACGSNSNDSGGSGDGLTGGAER